MSRAVILLAHGSSDPRWSRPIKMLLDRLCRRGLGADAVALAFLEKSRPTLETAVSVFAELGYKKQTVVPIFLGRGRHVSRDIGKKVAALRKRHKGVRITVQPSIGEQPKVIEAIAGAIAASIAAAR